MNILNFMTKKTFIYIMLLKKTAYKKKVNSRYFFFHKQIYCLMPDTCVDNEQ